MLKCLTDLAYNNQSVNQSLYLYVSLATSDRIKRYCQKGLSAAVHSFIYGQLLGGGSPEPKLFRIWRLV